MTHQVKENFFRHVRLPHLSLLAAAVSFGVVGGVALIWRTLASDSTVVLVNKSENPYPWLHVPQNKNLKLHAVNAKFENGELRTSYLNEK
eukprot:jgi/Hompol1/1334/HPOL_002684-RA